MQIKDNDIHNFHIKNILKKLEEKDLDAMLVANFNNIYYLSGYLSTSFAFMIIKENPIWKVQGLQSYNIQCNIHWKDDKVWWGNRKDA